jgi:hypothetical protein
MKIVRLSLIALVLLVTASCGGNSVSPTQATPPTLASFTTGTWALKVDRAWDGKTGAPQFPSDTLDESAYKPVSGGPAYQVVVSDKGQHVTIGGTIAGTVQAQRGKVTGTLVQYDVPGKGTFAGGRLVVWSSGNGLQGELTFYGSGVPITRSERGGLVSSQ